MRKRVTIKDVRKKVPREMLATTPFPGMRTMKERAIAYIEASLNARLSQIVHYERLRELRLETLGKAALSPQDEGDLDNQKHCVLRLREVLGVIRSAP